MAETQAEPQRPAQPHAPQPLLEKMPPGHQTMQFFPFAPGQQHQPLLQPPSSGDAEQPFSRPRYIAKIVLGSASLLCSIIIWAICIVMLARYATTGDDYYPDMSSAYYNTGEVPFEAGFAMAVAGLAIIWQAAEFITVWASKANRGIHPGAHVALHLVIWLVGAVAVGFIATFVAFDLEDSEEAGDDGDDSGYYSYSPDTSDYGSSSSGSGAGAWAARLRLEETLLAFACLLMLLHFVLFVRACVETHQYNTGRRTRTVYVQVPVQMAVVAPGGQQQPVGYFAYQPLPAQPQQAHLYRPDAPDSSPALPSRAPEGNRTPTVDGPSTTTAGGHGPEAGA